MGCDIHLFTEEKKTINNKKKWVNTDNWILNHYYDENNRSDGEKYIINPAYKGRNYALFSMLADVRNYSDNKPISKPKGLPDDVSDVVKYESDMFGSDGHSHSYFTMKELYEYYEKNKVVKLSGLVDEEGAKEIEAGNYPEWFCQSSNQEGLVFKEWEQENLPLKNFIQTIEEHFKKLYSRTKENPENYRIVFWFDN